MTAFSGLTLTYSSIVCGVATVILPDPFTSDIVTTGNMCSVFRRWLTISSRSRSIADMT